MTMRTLTVYFSTSSIDSTGYFNVLVSKEEKKLTGKKGGLAPCRTPLTTKVARCRLPSASSLVLTKHH